FTGVALTCSPIAVPRLHERRASRPLASALGFTANSPLHARATVHAWAMACSTLVLPQKKKRARDPARKRGLGPAGLRVALSREEIQGVLHRWCAVLPLEEQGLDDALAGEEHTIGEEHAAIRFAGARDPAGVLHLDPIGETLGDHEEVGVHDRRAV